MIAHILSKVFPPKLGKIQGVEDSIRLVKLREGQFSVYNPGPFESGAGRVFEWRDGGWRQKLRRY